MKKISVIVGLLLTGLIASCSSSSTKDDYFPDPERGDFVVVKSAVLKTLEGEELVDKKRFSMTYNNHLQPVEVVVTEGGQKRRWKLSYLEKTILNQLKTVGESGEVLSAWNGQFTGSTLTGWKQSEGGKGAIDYTYKGNFITEGVYANDVFVYGYDMKGRLSEAMHVQEGSKVIFAYSDNARNPFTHSKIDLFYGFFDESSLLSFLKPQEHSVQNFTKNGETVALTVEEDYFGFPMRIVGRSGGQVVVEFVYEYQILRSQE